MGSKGAHQEVSEVNAEQDVETAPLVHGKQRNYMDFGVSEWLGNLVGHFGFQLLFLLFVVQHLLKGFVVSFSSQADPYLYKSYGVPAPKMQIFTSVGMLPWAMKPVIGLVSDIFPVFGYNKAPYIVVTSIIGVACFLAIGLVSHDGMTEHSVVACIFLINLQLSTCDLLSEAKYAERIQDNPAHGPDLLTYVWFGLTVGGLVAVSFSGYVIEMYGPKANYLVSALPASLVLLPVLNGFLQETQLTPSQVSEIRARFFQQKEACALCVLMLVGTVTLTILGMVFEDPYVNGCTAIIVAVVMITAFSLVLSPTIAKFNAFSVIQGALSLSMGGASFYFYTDTPEQYPEGPHFTPFFYNTVMGVGGSICSLIGIYCYQRYMVSWKYRDLIVFTNIAFSMLCMLDLMMFKRMNVALGIPDHAFVLGSSVLESIVSQWMWMPQVVIMSYLCPKGMEATMYALLAGCANLGNAVASNVGAMVLDMLGCRPMGAVGESAQFENLWLASAIAIILPLGTVLALSKLVPDARQNEKLIGENDGDATSGSLWRSWTGQDGEQQKQASGV